MDEKGALIGVRAGSATSAGITKSTATHNADDSTIVNGLSPQALPAIHEGVIPRDLVPWNPEPATRNIVFSSGFTSIEMAYYNPKLAAVLAYCQDLYPF